MDDCKAWIIACGRPHKDLNPVYVPINPASNLPTCAILPPSKHAPPFALAGVLSEVHESNKNLTNPEKELLRWHQRLGHINFKQVKFLLNQGILAESQTQRSLHRAAAQVRSTPKCAACLFAKQQRRPTAGRTTTTVRDQQGTLSADQLLPGQKISVDHFASSTKGRLFSSSGRSNPDYMYSGGCIFVDHSSGYLDVQFQTRLNTQETLKAKEKFELNCLDHGITPQSYVTDQGSAFTSAEFAQQLTNFRQVHLMVGTAAHHHNGLAERAIGTVTKIARTMLIHAAIHWPETADSQLWPMAVRHAVYIYNRMPRLESGLSPHDAFTRIRWRLSLFHACHVWGCPLYVLDKRLADGKRIGRWESRSARQQYMGISPNYALTVPSSLNLATGRITSQFHVVFDDWFNTVVTDHAALPNFADSDWSNLFGTIEMHEQDNEDDEDSNEHSTRSTPLALQRLDAVTRSLDLHRPPVPLGPPLPTTEAVSDLVPPVSPPDIDYPVYEPSPSSSSAPSPGSLPLLETPRPPGPSPQREPMLPNETPPQRELLSVPQREPLSAPKNQPSNDSQPLNHAKLPSTTVKLSNPTDQTPSNRPTNSSFDAPLKPTSSSPLKKQQLRFMGIHRIWWKG